MRHAFLILVLPAALLAACATVPSAVSSTDGDFGDGAGVTAYGLFLAGEGALNDGRNRDAGAYFDRAAVDADDGPLLRERAFTAALLSGEVSKAAALAPQGEEIADSTAQLGRLVIAVDAIANGKGKLAREQLAGDTIAFPHRAAAVLLAPWAAATAGDLDSALVRPNVRGDRMVDFFGQYGQALLYERAKRYDEAETDFKALMSGDAPAEMIVLDYGAFLERRGRRADAIALYDDALEKIPDSVAVRVARSRADEKKSPPPMPSLRNGAAKVLLAPSATMISAKQNQLALAYLRLALRLNPDSDDAWLMLGDVQTSDGDMEAARTAYAHTRPNSPEYQSARAKLAWSYQNDKDSETALRLARESAAGGGTDARLTLSDLLRANEKYEESGQILSQLISETKKPDWRLLYARGVVYERLNRWPEAERDLEAALKLEADEPELLNYLGYSWIDRGLRLKEAMSMVERAVAANPKSGAMTDSLGWAYYRLGDFKKAVEFLETAVELEAGEPEINDHLGDAYWRVGRRDEAVFQWRRVLTLDPPEKIRAAAEAKLKSGLGPDGPASSPKIAEQSPR